MVGPLPDAGDGFAQLLKRYRGATPEALVAVLCPLLIPIRTLDKTIVKLPGQAHYRASFTVEVMSENRIVLRRGSTGKFVPGAYDTEDVAWREIAKGRIIEVDYSAGIASGEVYTGGTRDSLEAALEELSDEDLLEVDQYGAAAKVLSGLAERALVSQASAEGFAVYRMPEDMAKHLGVYPSYDYKLERGGVRKRVEVKSLWGTDTRFARLIHSVSKKRPNGDPSTWTDAQKKGYYPTSSCKFETQDIFAVNLFLRTGDIRDFAFARSVSRADRPYGLPSATGYPEHVNQNPVCTIGDGSWFGTIDEIWD